MRRIPLPEIEDQPWFPVFCRAAMTGALRRGFELVGVSRVIAEHLAPEVARRGVSQMVDLCSGSGGPTVELCAALRRRGLDLHVTLTDLFPNIPAFEALKRSHPGSLDFRPDPVDATQVPPELTGLRLVFNAFHHLPPEIARGVLRDAMEAGQPIAVYEVVGRQWPQALAMLGVPVVVPLVLPLVRPFDWRWIPLTYVLPVLQLTSVWDGLVSCLKIYDADELAELVAPLQRPGWRWEIGHIRPTPLPAHLTWLWGGPEI